MSVQIKQKEIIGLKTFQDIKKNHCMYLVQFHYLYSLKTLMIHKKMHLLNSSLFPWPFCPHFIFQPYMTI